MVPPYLNEPWDYFPFNDRDFTSVAELLMVPGCPPGLFTKQFAEFAPSSANVTSIFSQVTPLASSLTHTQLGARPIAPKAASNAFNAVPPTFPLRPHTFPYLVDKFFYTGASPTTATTSLFGDPTGDGWFKMFEFFEVPSQMIGAVGPVAQGTNFDWLRQDTKPGLINLNLIIDEEVFFSVFGSQDQNFNQQLLSFDQLPQPIFTGGTWTSTTTPPPVPLAAGASPIPLVVTATLAPPPGAPTTATGAPAAAYSMNNVGVVAYDRLTSTIDHRMKASFAQFLSLRHGGSGFVFGYGSGAVGQNFAVATSPANPNAPATPNLIPADRPFHSLSYPDINYTIMRPAALPPSAFTDPLMPTTPPTPAWPPKEYTGGYIGDPGVRNPSLYQGFVTNASATPPGSNPASILASQLLVPPAIPVRRLFQPPDYSPPITTTPPLPIKSNASEQGDPYINNLIPATAPVATGGLPLFLVAGTHLLCQRRRCEPVLGSERDCAAAATGGHAADAADEPVPWRELVPDGDSVAHRHEAEPLLPHRDVAEGDEPDHGADAPVRGLDHDRVLRGHAAGRSADGEREPGDVASHPGFRHPRARDRRLDRPDDAVPGLLPGRPTPAHRLTIPTHWQLPPGRRLPPDHRIMTLIVVSSQWPEMRERAVARVQK